MKGRKYEINEIKDNVVIEIFTEQEKNNYDDKWFFFRSTDPYHIYMNIDFTPCKWLSKS